MVSTPALRICTVLRLGSVPIFRIISGLAEGRTTNSTSSAVGGKSVAALPHVRLDASGQAAERFR